MKITISDGTNTVDFGAKVLNKLAVHVARTNDATGGNFTTLQWLVLHIRELAIADQLAAATAPMQQQAEADARRLFTEAVSAERERLLWGVC